MFYIEPFHIMHQTHVSRLLCVVKFDAIKKWLEWQNLDFYFPSVHFRGKKLSNFPLSMVDFWLFW